MGRLRPRERALLWLAYAQGHAHTEIADTLGVKTGSVKLLLFRARRKLAGILRAVPGAHRWRPVVKTVDCCREEDVLDALTSGRWPDRADDELVPTWRRARSAPTSIDVASAVLEVRNDEPGEMRDSLVGGDVVAGADARAPGSRTRGRPADHRGAGRRAGDAGRRERQRSSSRCRRGSPAVVGGWMPERRQRHRAWRRCARSGVLAQGWVLSPLSIGLGVWLVLAPVAIYFAVADD